MDLVKDLGGGLSDSKPFSCHRARLPGVTCVTGEQKGDNGVASPTVLSTASLGE